MAQVVLEDLYKSFPAHARSASVAPASPAQETAGGDQPEASAAVAVLKRINLTVKDGEFMVLVGPSGCGKSTLLRLIAGLEVQTAGNIWVGDQQVNTLPPKARDIAMVFQSYALYPHMTVYNNLAFGLRRTGESTAQGLRLTAVLSDLWSTLTRWLPGSMRFRSVREQRIAAQVHRVAEMLQIDALLDRLPKQLSGGQKQRVALGRAMARNPQVFLMDEPLSNLDAKLRAQTRSQIVQLQQQLGTTTIYVTHDQTEAMTMGDRIAVMNGGEIQQIATPLTLYHHPANQFVAAFIGSPPMNFVAVQVTGALQVEHPLFQLLLPARWTDVLQGYQGRTVTLGIRPEHLTLTTQASDHLPAQVERVEALGHETYVSLNLVSDSSLVQGGEEPYWQARINAEHRVQVGDLLWFGFPADKIHLFDPESGQAIG